MKLIIDTPVNTQAQKQQYRRQAHHWKVTASAWPLLLRNNSLECDSIQTLSCFNTKENTWLVAAIFEVFREVLGNTRNITIPTMYRFCIRIVKCQCQMWISRKKTSNSHYIFGWPCYIVLQLSISINPRTVFKWSY